VLTFLVFGSFFLLIIWQQSWLISGREK
jgi:hypothetical protein